MMLPCQVSKLSGQGLLRERSVVRGEALPHFGDARVGVDCFIYVLQPECQRCTIARAVERLVRLECFQSIRVEQYAARSRSEAVVIVGPRGACGDERAALHVVGCLPAFADTMDALRRDVLAAQREAIRCADANNHAG